MQTAVKYPMLLLCSMMMLLLISCSNDALIDDTVDEDAVPEDSVAQDAVPLTVLSEQDAPLDDAGDAQLADSESQISSPDAKDFTLQLGNSYASISEGQGQAEISISVIRNNNHQDVISLTASDIDSSEDIQLTRQFTDSSLDADEPSTSLRFNLAIGPKPIQPHTRTLLISATDTSGQRSNAELALQITPTTAPDVYLLIGQSNMMGSSEDGAKKIAPGQPDAPLDTIRQLNVTFNDITNFSQAADFTNPAKLFNSANPVTVALDPLHAGMTNTGDKEGTRIGMGLSFAKRAKQETTAEIYLVPAAWSDTGFCKRPSNPLPGVGWNATRKTNPALSGTLLHDRAIARTNATLAQTNGILRGILWHQGEADVGDADCAQTYAENLIEMIQSLRSNIAVDARGPSARGPEVDIPFIVGTMSKGAEQSPFVGSKLLIDSAHRNISSNIRYADFVNNDDLIPPAYNCGNGSCIHFGADALREMGVRYYESLISVLQ